MKELYFYILFAVLFAAQAGLIMGEVLDPLTAYSARNIVFSVFVAAVVIYMGWNLSDFGIKKVAIKGYSRICWRYRHRLFFHTWIHHWETNTRRIGSFSSLHDCSYIDNTLVEHHTVYVACSSGSGDRAKIQAITK